MSNYNTEPVRKPTVVAEPMVFVIPDYPEDIAVPGFVSSTTIVVTPSVSDTVVSSHAVPDTQDLEQIHFADETSTALLAAPVEFVPTPVKQEVSLRTSTFDSADYLCFGLQAVKYSILGGIICIVYTVLNTIFALVASSASVLLGGLAVCALAGWAVLSRPLASRVRTSRASAMPVATASTLSQLRSSLPSTVQSDAPAVVKADAPRAFGRKNSRPVASQEEVQVAAPATKPEQKRGGQTQRWGAEIDGETYGGSFLVQKKIKGTMGPKFFASLVAMKDRGASRSEITQHVEGNSDKWLS